MKFGSFIFRSPKKICLAAAIVVVVIATAAAQDYYEDYDPRATATKTIVTHMLCSPFVYFH